MDLTADAETTTSEAKSAVQLLAAGFNAHKQLSAANQGKDVRLFSPISNPTNGEKVQLLYSCWSSTILKFGTHLFGLGSQDCTITLQTPATEVSLYDAFGDHDGMNGCLDTAGRLHLLDTKPNPQKLECQGDDAPLLSHIAVAGNEKVAITFKQAPNGRLCHVLTFDSLPHFLQWFRDPSGGYVNHGLQLFMMQGRPKLLLANTATFLMLMESGEVYSWGDARHQSLGRSIADHPAEKPALVDALGGLKICKVACGGWMNAALSEDGACYVWGAGTPGTGQAIRSLRESSAGAVVLVELPTDGTSEPLDIVDVAIGDNHVAVLAEGGRLFVVGDNKYGQLGLGLEVDFVDDWKEISGTPNVLSVQCGPQATFVFATPSNGLSS